MDYQASGLGLLRLGCASLALGVLLSSTAQADEVYTIRRGDSLGRIAARAGLTLAELMRANGITGSGALIYPGQVLVIPDRPAATTPAVTRTAPTPTFRPIASRTPSTTTVRASSPIGDADSGAQGGAIRLDLRSDVGTGEENHMIDVSKVSMRLTALGFMETPMATVNGEYMKRLKLFQSITRGSRTVGGDGMVREGNHLHRWLQAENAPMWQMMPGSGAGFTNYEVNVQTGDDHDYGTNWTAAVIRGAGRHYRTNYMEKNTAAIMEINDVSRRWGGDTPDHAGHETGLDIDVRLPTTNGTSGTTIGSRNYDRDATRAMIQAFRAQPQVSRVLFNDQALINEGLCQYSSGHGNHFHVDVSPPGMRAGSLNAAAVRADSSRGSSIAPSALAALTKNNSASSNPFLSALNSRSAAPAGVAAVGPNGEKEKKNDPMQASGSDLEVLARIIKGEALHCSEEGKIAVAAVVLNRVREKRWPNSIRGVAHQPKQFSCYNRDVRHRLYYGKVPQSCFDAAKKALEGRDPSMGANHYFNPYIVQPKWAKRMKFLKRIGTKKIDTHDFYKG